MSDDRATLIAGILGTRSADLGRLLDVTACPPGRPFPPRYALLSHRGCKATNQRGGQCNAHPILVGDSGYCHWHDPARANERSGWRGRGFGYWRRLYEGVISSRDGGIDTGINNPVPCSLPVLLADAAPGVRRVALALVAEPAGRTYHEAAEVLGVTIGTVRRQVVRLKERHPEAHAALLALREEQRATRHQRAEDRHRATWAQRRADHLAQHGREPWA